MKHVFDTNEIPHLWAHKTQQDARNPQGNLYFNEDVIYSYGSHFPIARHITTANGAAVMLTSRSYSSTTAGHISAVRGAIPHDVPVFRVSHPTSEYREWKQEHAQIVESARKALAQQTRKASKALKYRALQSAIQDANALLEFFGSEMRHQLPPDAKELEAIAQEYEQEVAYRRATRNRNRIARWEAENARRLQEAQDSADRMPELLAAWRRGENPPAFINHGWDVFLPTMLRLVGDEVETSKGARVPIPHAIVGLTAVKRVMESGVEYQRNGHTIHLGHYPIDRITVDGTLHAGCHVISFTEIKLLEPALRVWAAEHRITI